MPKAEWSPSSMTECKRWNKTPKIKQVWKRNSRKYERVTFEEFSSIQDSPESVITDVKGRKWVGKCM